MGAVIFSLAFKNGVVPKLATNTPIKSQPVQVTFKFADCYNGEWSNFMATGVPGLSVRAEYVKNSVADQWWLQFDNITNSQLTFYVTVSLANGSSKKAETVNANSVSRAFDPSIYGWDQDIFVYCSFNKCPLTFDKNCMNLIN